MLSAKTYILGLFSIIMSGVLTWLLSTNRLPTPLLTAGILFLSLGILYTVILKKNNVVQQKENTTIIFTSIVFACIFIFIYFVNTFLNQSSFLLAGVFSCCFLLPFTIAESYKYLSLALAPNKINPWVLPAPANTGRHVSLYLNSLQLTFRFSIMPNATEENFSVTTPGIKTLGSAFSDIFYDEKYQSEALDFSDIKKNNYQWIFFVQEYAGIVTRQLDANWSLIDNDIKNNTIITARRVQIL